MAHMLHYLTVPLLIAHISSRWYVMGTLLVLIVLYEALKHQQTVSGSIDDCQRVGNSVTTLSVPNGVNPSKIMMHTVPGSYYKVMVPAVSWWESHPFRWVLAWNAALADAFTGTQTIITVMATRAVSRAFAYCTCFY